MKKVRLILIAVALSLVVGMAANTPGPASALAPDGDPPPVCPDLPCNP